MKIYKSNINRCKAFLKGVAAAMLLLPLTSCDNSFIFEDEGDCAPHYFVKYVFDMNMQYADAFPSKVSSVRLFVFDLESGDLVKEFSESGETLKKDGYRMEIDIDPGRYDLVAWCGMEDNKDHFVLPQTITNREHIHCTMARTYDAEYNATQNEYLTPLFHGRLAAELPDMEGEHTVTLHLIKDTNNINISLQHVSGEPLTVDMFTVTMAEGNGHMAFDNSLLDDEDVIYSPWSVTDGNIDISVTKADDETALNFFKAEISTARLMADRDPRINIVANETGETVYSIPIVNWALLLRSSRYSDMDDQEYLDREDQYNVMLYLDNDKGWKAAQIWINGWRVVNHDDVVMGE